MGAQQDVSGQISWKGIVVIALAHGRPQCPDVTTAHAREKNFHRGERHRYGTWEG